jgi:hypothetical protein
VSQLHARAMQRLRKLLSQETPLPAAPVARPAAPKPARPRLAHCAPKRPVTARLRRPAPIREKRVA